MLADVLDAQVPVHTASLVILNLLYHQIRETFPQVTDATSYLHVAKSIISASFNMTTDDGVCCVVAIDEKNPKVGTTDMLGTKAVSDTGSWCVTDEIIWTREKLLGDDREGLVLDSDYAPFSQIWVLTKQKHPSRADSLMGQGLALDRIEEIVSPVWSIPPGRGDYQDPIPLELLSRLILSYSKPSDLVLDPIAGHCATSTVCVDLGRNSLCFVRNDSDLRVGKKRLEEDLGT